MDVCSPHRERLLEDLLHGLDRFRDLAIDPTTSLTIDWCAIFAEDHNGVVDFLAYHPSAFHREPLFKLFLHPQLRGDQERHLAGESPSEHLAGRRGLAVAEGDIPEERSGEGHQKERQQAQAVLVGDEEPDRPAGHEGERPREVLAEDLPEVGIDPDTKRGPGGGQQQPGHSQPHQAVDRGR